MATKALNDLYGNTLNGLIKGGGIRLSYSKNPLGVRTPTSAGSNGPSLQQQQLQGNSHAPGGPSPFPPDAFQPRDPDAARPAGPRRDSAIQSPPPPSASYSYMVAPPPPRFFSPTPSSVAFGSGAGAPLAAATAFPRAGSLTLHGYSSPPSNAPAFAPWGMSPQHSTIPDQTSAEATNTII